MSRRSCEISAVCGAQAAFHHWRSRQTKHGAGCKRGRNDMQLCGTPVIGWPSSRARCHWANVVKVTGQTRDSHIQILVEMIVCMCYETKCQDKEDISED